jgi:hypothetical protein
MFVLLMVAAAAVGASASEAGDVTAAIRLPRRTITAGEKLEAKVVVRNRTGAPVEFVGCGIPFAVALHNRSVPALLAWPACATSETIPVGTTTYRVPVSTRYTSCDADGPVRCVGLDPPPLPPGRYTASLYEHPKVLTEHARPLRVRLMRGAR